MATTRESKIEAHLRRRAENAGGKCWKFVSPQLKGVPDRVLMLPGARLWFVELKAPKNEPGTSQTRRHKELWALGQKVLVLDSIEAVDQFMDGVAG